MQKTWRRRNVDLYILSNQIEEFLKSKDFEIIREDKEGKYKILAQNSPEYQFSGYLSVTITGTLEEFAIELEFHGISNKNIYLSRLLTFFGGGYLFLQDLRSQENRAKFERDFWQHVYKTIKSLSNTINSNEKL
ncbi:MAG: hypothetical protein QW175_00290 [Candidatus Bathyarchaeia archaeon]